MKVLMIILKKKQVKKLNQKNDERDWYKVDTWISRILFMLWITVFTSLQFYGSEIQDSNRYTIIILPLVLWFLYNLGTPEKHSKIKKEW